MTEKTEPGFMGIGTKRDFTFELVGEYGRAQPLRADAASEALLAGARSVSSDLKEKSFTSTCPNIKTEMYKETVSEGYYRGNPQDTRTRFQFSVLLRSS